ncbi:MAG: ROK family protein [Pseudomonadales bacterium]
MRIGIDLGGTKIEAAMLDADGDIICRYRVPTPQSDYSQTLSAIAGLIFKLEKDCSVTGQCVPVGVATPGAISSVTGRMKNCNSTCLNGQPLREDLSRRLKREVRIANDADCFALSEAQDGAASNYSNVFGVILGTGVGGGIVINKQLLSGVNGIAGEWGHNPMPLLTAPDSSGQSRHCYCGRKDCVESWLSGPAFEQSYLQMASQSLKAPQIAFNAKNGDLSAIAVLDGYCEALAAALAVVINVLDPQVVVLGGGLSNIAYLYEQVPQRWGKYIFTDRCETRLLGALHGDSSGVRGAAWLWS